MKVHTPTGTLNVSVGQINNDPLCPAVVQGLNMHTGGVDTVSLNDVHHKTDAR